MEPDPAYKYFLSFKQKLFEEFYKQNIEKAEPMF